MLLKIFNHKKPVERHSDYILITGDGRSLMLDMKEFLSWGIPHDAGCIGRSVNVYPGLVDHWFNVDASESVWWAKNLLAMPRNGNGILRHTMGDIDGFDVDWEIIDPWPIITDKDIWHGSTSLFAALCAVAMNYEKIVLAGCPMDQKGHWYFEDIGPRWTVESFMAWLEFAKQPEAQKVKSLSGYTGQIMGIPTKEWLDAG